MDTDSPTSDTLTLSLRRPADVLAYLPYRFGFVPTDSLAVLGVIETGAGRMLLGTAARLDLEALEHPDGLRGSLAAVGEQLLLDDAAWAFTVVYADAPFGRTAAGQGRAGQALDVWLAASGFSEPTSTFLVTPERFRCLECAEPPCCPRDGHPVSLLQETAVAAGMVVAGESLVGSRADLACPTDVDARRAATAAAAAQREALTMLRQPNAHQARWRRGVLTTYATALRRAAVDEGPAAGRTAQVCSPRVAGRLAAALRDADIRDAVVAWTMSGRRHRPGAPEVLDVFEGMLTGELPPPSAEHVQASRRVLTDVVRHAGPGLAAHPLAILGWLAWWRGDGARADVLVHQCLDADPGCRLGLLLRHALDHGLRPGWAAAGRRVA